MTKAFTNAEIMVRRTGGNLSDEEMEEFELLALGFDYDEKKNGEMNLRETIYLAQSPKKK
jgi:hypothetical protein